jgi:hypothetical protein
VGHKWASDEPETWVAAFRGEMKSVMHDVVGEPVAEFLRRSALVHCHGCWLRGSR